MSFLTPRSIPLLLVASLVMGALVIAPPAVAVPCYEDGQPNPPSAERPPDLNRAKDKCQAAANKVVEVATNGYYGTYSLTKLQERLVYHTNDGGRDSFLSCMKRTSAATYCAPIYGRNVAPEVDKGVNNYQWICYFAQAGFAPTTPPPPSIPLVPVPGVPLVLACFPSAVYGMAYGVAGASPDLQKQLPGSLTATYVGSTYVWPTYHTVLDKLNELP